MSSKRPAPTKRERARNEQALKDLLKVPGNDRCADCNAMNPGWASWSIGVFLCTRCASIHRKLGTHISKVKSLSLDNWESDQVLRLIGNIKANAVWNPDPSKHPIPLNTEESDSIMERYVRNKYEYKLFRRDRAVKEQERIKESLSSGHRDSNSAGLSFSRPSGSSGSSGGSSSGASIASNHSSSSYTRPNPPHRSVSASVHRSAGGSRSSSPPSKIGQVLGVEPVHQQASLPCQLTQPTTAGLVSMQGVSGGLEDTIRQLRDMGFTDDRRTLDVLKQTGGNVQTTIEILTRMGGGNFYGRRNESAPSGLTNQRTGDSSSNPFDELDRQEKIAQQKQAQQQQQIEQQQEQIFQQQQQLLRQASLGVTNPYGNMYQQNPALFPHRTGPEQLHASNPFSQMSSIPATPTMAGQYQPQNPYSSPNTLFTQLIPTPPLVQSPQSTGLSATNPYSAQPSPLAAGYNPFLTQQTLQVQQPQFQTAPSPFGMAQPANPQQQLFMQQQQNTNAYSLSNAPNDLFNPQHNSFQPPQQLIPQPTGRLDKSAILSLYNMPHLAPTPPPQPQPQPEQQPQQLQTTQPTHQPLGTSNAHLQTLAQKFASSSIQGQVDMQRSNSEPVLTPQSNNPFQQQSQVVAPVPVAQNSVSARGMGVAGAGAGRGHMTQESVDFGNWMSQSGRHSPDAFASLSFRQ